jgi:P2 family phage contractile tail tube protein
MSIASIIKSWTLEVGGIGYAGRAKSLKPPALAVETMEYKAGGMAGAVKVDMASVAAMDCGFTLYDYAPAVIKLWGQADGNSAVLTFRGAAVNDAGAVTPIKLRMRGQVQELTKADWEPAGEATLEVLINCRSYEEIVNAETLIHIDIERMVRKVGGVDQMAAIRGALGV